MESLLCVYVEGDHFRITHSLPSILHTLAIARQNKGLNNQFVRL